MDVTIVTRFRNRLAQLSKSLPSWLGIGWSAIIVVDWSSSEDVLPLLASTGDPRITLLRVKGRKNFERSAAWNVGIEAVQTSNVSTIDCDVLLHPDFLKMLERENCLYMAGSFSTSIVGCQLMPKFIWEDSGGYNENMSGWGNEDLDLHRRVRELGHIVCGGVDDTLAVHQEHSNALRGTNDLAGSNGKNAIVALQDPWDRTHTKQKFDIEVVRPC